MKQLLFTILILLSFPSAVTRAQDNLRTRASGAWEDPAIWEKWNNGTQAWINAQRTPNASDTITVKSGHSVTASTTLSVYVFTLNGTLTLGGGSLLTTGPCTLAGSLTGSGTIEVTAPSCDISNLTTSLPLNVAAFGSVAVTGNSFALNAAFTNYGTANFVNNGPTAGSTGSITNYGVINCSSGMTLCLNVTNYGTITSASTFDVNFQKLTTTASSIITVNPNAKLSILATVTPYSLVGVCNVAAGGTFEFANGSVPGIINLNGTIQGAGKVKFSSFNSTIYCNGIYNITGTSNFALGNVIFPAACTLQSIGSILGTGGKATFDPGLQIKGISKYLSLYYSTLTLNTGAAYVFDSIYVDNGTIAGDTITVTKKFTSYGCTLNGSAPLYIAATCTSMTSGNPFSVNRPVFNDGTMDWYTNSFYGTSTFTNSGTLRYLSSGTSFQSSLVNTASGILIFNGTGPVWLTCTLTNTGIINLLTNQVNISANPGDQAVGGVINISTGSTLAISNDTISATVNCAGTLTTTGSNSFRGTYNSTGTLIVSSGSVYFLAGCTIPSVGIIASRGGAIYFRQGAVPNGIQDTLTIYGKIEFSGGKALTFKDVSIGYYGTLDGSDSIIVTRTFSHQGYLYGTGRKILTAACSGSIFNSGWVSDTLCNYGVLDWKDGDIKNYGRIINYGVFKISAASAGNSYLTIENYGTITRPAATSFAITFFYPVINNGTIGLNSGTNVFYGNSAAVPITGIINAAAGTTVNFYNTDLNGTVNASHIVGLSGTVNVNGIFNNSGTTTNTNGTATFKSAASIPNIGTINCAAGAMYFKPGAVIQAMSGIANCIGLVDFSTGKKIELATVFIDWHGTLGGTDSVTVSSSFTHTGYLSGYGKKILLNTCSGTLSNNAWISDSLYNYGTLAWNDLDVANGGRIFNYGTFNIIATGNSTAYVSIENYGTVNRTTTNVSTLTFNSPFINSGILNINGGTAYVLANSSNTAAGVIFIAPSAKLQLSAAASLGGAISLAAGATLTSSSYTLTFTGSSLVNDGIVSTSSLTFSANTAVSGGGAVNTAATIASGGSVTLLSNHQFKTLSVNTGGTFTAGQYTLRLNGSGNPLSVTGALSAPAGGIEFNGTAAQTAAPATLTAGTIIFNNVAGVTLSAAWQFAGTIRLAAGVFNNAAGCTLGNNARIVRSAGTIQTTPSVTGRIHIMYSHNAPIATANELPNGNTQIASITIDDTAGVTLSKNITVNDSVVFAAGNLFTTANYILTLAPAALLVNESNAGYVVGSVYIDQTIGTGSSAFGNIGVTLSAGADSLGAASILRKTGAGAAFAANGNTTINRQWLITSQFPPAGGRSVTFRWLTADDNGLIFPPYDFAEVWRYRNLEYESLWNMSSVFGMNPRALTIDGVTEFGTFSAGLHSKPLKNKKIEITALIDGFYNGSAMAPDTVSVSFTSTTAPYMVFDSVNAVPDANGLMTVASNHIVNGDSYFLRLRHRNALETWSAAPVSMTNYNFVYDFTTAANKAYGDNLKPVGGKFCLYGGDVNQDGIVDFTDVSMVDNDSYNFTFGYVSTDLNGDNFVDFTDLGICDNSSVVFASVIRPGDFPRAAKELLQKRAATPLPGASPMQRAE